LITPNLAGFRNAQEIARKTMDELSDFISAGMSIEEINTKTESSMLELDATGFWYHGIPANIFSGEETGLFSKEHFFSSAKKRKVNRNDIIWIDLAPQAGEYLGDYTRTLIICNNHVLKKKDYDRHMKNPAVSRFIKIIKDSEEIQNKIMSGLLPEMTFDDLFDLTLAKIMEYGYECPDVRLNFGHTLPSELKDRQFIVKHNKTPIRGTIFTHEFQIGHEGLGYSARIEDIYFLARSL